MEEAAKTSSSAMKPRLTTPAGGGRIGGEGPALITDFLLEQCNTLLMKGSAGTGKTILGLEVLRRLGGKRQGIYFSSNTSFKRLKQQHPWIEGIMVPKDKTLQAELDGAWLYEDVRSVDMKMLLQLAYESLLKHERPMLIFDGWDAFAEIDPVERLKAEKSLIHAIDERQANGIFIYEGREDTSLDYFVDGLVTIRSKLQGQVRLREMVIEKIRGKPVDKLVRLFTLRGGRFQELPEFEYSIASNPEWFEPLPDTESHYSAGSRSIDSFLGGGLSKGTILLVEIAPDTARTVLSAFLGVNMLNFINKGNSALVALSRDMEEGALKRQLQPYSSPMSMNNLRIVSLSKVEDILTNYMMMRTSGKRSTIVILDSSNMDLAEDHEHLLDLCRNVRENNDLLIIVSDGVGEAFSKVKRCSDLHVKFWQIDRYVLVKEVRHINGCFALDFDVTDGRPSLELAEVV